MHRHIVKLQAESQEEQQEQQEQEEQASPKFLGSDGTRGLKFGNLT